MLIVIGLDRIYRMRTMESVAKAKAIADLSKKVREGERRERGVRERE